MKVVPERPGRGLLYGALAFVVIAGVGLGSYQLGRTRAAAEWESVENLLAARDAATERTLDLERRLADAELSKVVDSEANEQLRKTIKSLRDELAETAEEVRFYRGLMAPSEAQKGVRIEKLDLTDLGEDRYGYRLLMTQIVDRHDWVKGGIELEVIGTQNGQPRVLSLTDLGEVDNYPLQFKFRYFQDFTGTVALPEGFQPTRVVVTAETSGKELQRAFAWALQEE